MLKVENIEMISKDFEKFSHDGRIAIHKTNINLKKLVWQKNLIE